jgi:hypothetical protein
MTPQVDFVSLDPQGIITRENWVATRLHCPKCGRSSGAVWALTSEPPVKIGEMSSPVFLCINCLHTAVGLGGYEPRWDRAERAKQIYKFGFAEAE